MSRTLLALLLTVAAAVVVNVMLLRVAASNDDPVGKLTPRVDLPAAPADVVRPRTGPLEHDDHSDD